MKIKCININYINEREGTIESIHTYINKKKDIKNFIIDLFLKINENETINFWLSNTSIKIKDKQKPIKLNDLALKYEYNWILDKFLKQLKFKQLYTIKKTTEQQLNILKFERKKSLYKIIECLNKLVVSTIENKKERKRYWTLIGSLIAAFTGATTVIFTIISKLVWKI